MSMAHYARGAHLVIANERAVSVDAKSKALATQLAIEKALAYVDDPAHYPLPDDLMAPENVVAARLRRLPPLRRRRMVKALLRAFREQHRRTNLGTLACIDLGSRKSVLAQVRALSMAAFSEAEEREVIERFASFDGEHDLIAFWAMA
jgi:hypothetical protein